MNLSRATSKPATKSTFFFTFDSRQLAIGEYEAVITIFTNDPNQNEIHIAAFLRVDPARPRIEFEWLSELFEDQGNWNDVYPDLFNGPPYRMSGVIRNLGDQVLTVEASTTNEVFTVEPVNFEIEGQSEAELVVTLEADEPGRYEGVFLLHSNDPENQEIRFPMVAEVINPPEIGPVDDFIEEILFTGEIIQHIITIDNNGGALLRFIVEIEIIDEQQRDKSDRILRKVTAPTAPIRDDRGDLLAQFNIGAQQFKNLAYDPVNELMWLINFNTGTATAYDFDDDYNNLREVRRINPGGSMDGVCVNGILYLPAFFNPVIHRFNENGQNIGAINTPFIIRGIACDPDEGWLFVQSANDDFIHVLSLNNGVPDWNEIGVIRNHRQFHGNLVSYGLEWVNDHWDGQLWMTSPQNRQVHQILVDTDDWTCIEEVDPFIAYPAQDEPYSAVAHDGRNLWVGGCTNASIRIYDDGISELHWIIVEPMEGEIEPGEWLDLVVTLDATGLFGGEYWANIHIWTNDPANPDVVVSVELWIPEAFDFQPWEVFPTDENHSILVTEVNFDGDPVPAGWWIGVFTPEGVAAGIMRWNDELDGLPVWGADDAFPDYFHEGELMSFLIYDPESDQEYRIWAIVEEGDLHWTNNGLTILSLENGDNGAQEILLRQGWSLMSFNIIPGDEFRGIDGVVSVPEILAQFRRPDEGAHRVIICKDQNGRFYAPAHNWNGIPFWNLQEGYQIKLDEDAVGMWEGLTINPQADIPLRRGWNIIPYYPTYELEATRASGYYVISPIRDHVVIAKDENGNFMIPAREFAMMPPWRPGKAYQINVDQAVVLNYPEERQMRVMGDGDGDGDRGHFQSVSRTGRNMSVLLNAEWGMRNDECGMMNAEWEIGFFTTKGQCVGSVSFQIPNSKFQIGLPVWGDDPSTPEIDGALEGEPLEFRLWNGTDETSVLPIWESGHAELTYETDGFAMGEIGETGISILPEAVELYPPTPNPFNSITRIEFALPVADKARLTLFDETGRIVRLISEGGYPAGKHRIAIDGEGLAAGVYLLKLETSGKVITQKAVLVK